VVHEDGGDAYGVQKTSAGSNAWSSSKIVSWRSSEDRLEAGAASVRSRRRRGARLAAEQGKKRCQGGAPCRGNTAGRRRVARGHRRQRIWPEELADGAKAGEQFEQPGGAILGERRGGMEREMWGSYRRGRGAVSAAG
jgi:hypothetical protein